MLCPGVLIVNDLEVAEDAKIGVTASAMGIATMHPAKKSHTAVCSNFVSTRSRTRFDLRVT